MYENICGGEMSKIIIKPTVLVVEDDNFNNMLMVTLLKRSGCNAISVENGLDAVEVVKTDADLAFVLMDIKMPIMNGLEATKRIKSLRPQLPIIAITAYSDVEEEKRIYEAGCDMYFAKPINQDVIPKLLKKYVKTE